MPMLHVAESHKSFGSVSVGCTVGGVHVRAFTRMLGESYRR